MGDNVFVSDVILAAVDDCVGADIACYVPSAGVRGVPVVMIDARLVYLLFHLVIIYLLCVATPWSVPLSCPRCWCCCMIKKRTHCSS